MAVNDRMTNERLQEWNHFKEIKRRRIFSIEYS